MKKLKLLFLLFLITSAGALKAQQKDSYIHLIDVNKIWNIGAMAEFGDLTVISYSIYGDTLFNDTLYYKLGQSPLVMPILIREDTVTKKIYTRRYDYAHEQLYYDFSMEIGDSITGVDWPCTLYLDSIAEISYFEKQRKTYYFHSNWFDEWEDIGFNPIWIEGIGSLSGIVSMEKTPTLNWVGYTEVNCYFKDSILYYQSEMASIYGCHFEDLSNNELSDEKFKIYPNPAVDKVFIETSHLNTENCYVEIFDVIGSRVLQTQLFEDKIELNLINLKAGLYLIKIYNQSQILLNSKLLKL